MPDIGLNRRVLASVQARVKAASDLRVEITLTPAEADQLWLHLRSEPWRTKCRRMHIEDLRREGKCP